MLQQVMRQVLAREAIPARPRWWMAASGMRDWYGFLGSRLRAHLGERSRTIVSRAAVRTLTRRAEALRAAGALAIDPTAPSDVALLGAGLYRIYAAPKAAWILEAAPGMRSGASAWWRARRLVAPLDAEARWREVTVHLGELLVVMTEDLPAELAHARRILGDICKEAGGRYARRMMKAWGIDRTPSDAPGLAIEILRTSEYLFRVNPEHWSESDAAKGTGYLEGTACPWFDRPGWNGAHCGIFGQFQAGVTAELGLKYILEKTIPKHGGDTCRVELKPLPPEKLVRPRMSRS